MFRKNVSLFTMSLSFALVATGCDLIQDGGTTSTSVPSITTPPTVTVTPDNPPTGTTSSGGDNTAQQAPPQQTDIEEGFLIENGAQKTSHSQLGLQMITLSRYQMKVSPDRDCQTGSWQDYAEFPAIPTPARNQVVYVSVQFKDWDGGVSRCYRQSILHDDLGPQILFTHYPATSVEEGFADNVALEISDAAGTVAGTHCGLSVTGGSVGATIPVGCVAGRNVVDISAMMAGHYVLNVAATDDLGNASSQAISWDVVSTTRALAQSVTVDNYKKVDILVVIDNSGSMAYEQQSMASRVRNFLSVIRGLDWQIAVTTTDPTNVALGDGRLIPIHGTNGQVILDTSTPEEVAQDRLGRTLQRPETGSGSEQGIRAVYRTIERFAANETAPRAFFRTGAQFAVVLISDEDESANAAKNDPQNLIGLVHSTFGGQKRFGFHSIITKPGDTQCRNTDGYSYGDRYKTMSDLTGGIIGSVCATDYASQMVGIANGVRDLLKTLSLQCAPLAQYPITIKKDGVAVATPYRIDGVNLKFDNELDPGDYTIAYRCVR